MKIRKLLVHLSFLNNIMDPFLILDLKSFYHMIGTPSVPIVIHVPTKILYIKNIKFCRVNALKEEKFSKQCSYGW